MFTEDRAIWIYDHYRWLEGQLPPRQGATGPCLVTPSPEAFPIRNTRDHAFAEAMFHCTREYMGLLEWPCRLASHVDRGRDQQDAFRQAGLLGQFESDKGAGGTFSVGPEVVITYSPALLNDPSALVATLAHELCHYLLATVKDEPPCTWKEHEPLTDLAAVHEGFGIFLANSAFSFSQWTNNDTQGWQWQKRGYLSEAELGFALGVFVVRNQIDPELAGRHLKRNPAEVFWDSLGYVDDLEAKT